MTQTSQPLSTAAALTLLLVGGACASPPVPPESPASADMPPTPTGQGEAFVFVFLTTGPADLDEEAAREAGSGHFANMERLWNLGLLLVAGPLGEPKVDPAHRGLFVFDVDSVPAAEWVARTDPGVASGMFDFEAVPFRSAWPLHRLKALEEEDQRAGTSGMRSYVIALSEHGAEAAAAMAPLEEEGLVAFSGAFGGAREGTVIFVLEVEGVDEAREMTRAVSGETDLAWRYLPWYGASSVSRMDRPVPREMGKPVR